MTEVILTAAGKTSSQTALILGATGGIGGAIAEALLHKGWTVRGLARNAAQAGTTATSGRQGIGWHEGDAFVADDVVQAARGMEVIVHAVNPPGYRNWDRLVLPMIDNSIAAARKHGACVVLPGTVYNFDARHTPVVGADTPQRPSSRKGAVRAELERRLKQAAPEVRSFVLRAGDFFGPTTRSSWFSQVMAPAGKPLNRITDPVQPGVGHSWAYLPDLAEAFARLIEMRDRLQPFERLQFAGTWDENGDGMVAAIRAALEQPGLPVRRFPWWLMRLAAPFGGLPREIAEIAPHFAFPMRFDNTRLVEVIGPEPATPLAEAMRRTLHGLGCR